MRSLCSTFAMQIAIADANTRRILTRARTDGGNPGLADSSESEGAAPTPTRPRASRRRSLRERRATSRSSGSESDSDKTTAHNDWNRATLVPTRIENTALQVLKYMRPQPDVNFASGQVSIQPADDGRAETRTHPGSSSATDLATSGGIKNSFGIKREQSGHQHVDPSHASGHQRGQEARRMDTDYGHRRLGCLCLSDASGNLRRNFHTRERVVEGWSRV